LNGITTTGYQLFRQDSAGIQDVSEENDWFGNALAAGDFNDDGFRDLAIGAPQETINNVFAAGAVHVIYGSASGLSATAGPGNQFFRQGSGGLPDQPEQFDYFGSTLSAWNFGANYVIPAIPGVPPIPGRIVRAADLAIGVARESVVNSNNVNVSTAGVVHVLYGSTGGLATAGGAFATDDQLWHQDVTGIPDSVESGDFFGSALY
jgi:hypothetical protein